FNSLQVKAEKRMSHGMWMLVSYTWSKFISSGIDQQFGAGYDQYSGLISPYQRQRNKSLDSQDVPHTVSWTTVYELPMGKGHRFLGTQNAFASRIFSGWQINTVFRAQSGTPYIFRSGQCNIPSQFGMACIPSILNGANVFNTDPGSYDPGSGPLFNRDAFQNGSNGGVFSFDPGAGSRTSGVRQAPFEKLDFVLEKNTKITEGIKLQIRAEFFNVFNWHFFSQGTTWGQGQAFITDVGSPLFGQWTGAVTTPRNIQLAARLAF
ncbi:MAG TPA: hypothetical protein VLT57_11685, partial [Bryobacteraceae bacterium]|nr:hypothetical protein [Bryobacteraceae bacterium]